VARFLAFDLDNNRLNIVGGSTTRKGVVVEKTLSWTLAEELTPANGENLGKGLRDALKAAGIPSAPVMVSVGRERVILKEVRFPAVGANEEPALVRFQTAKELTENPEESIIDYVVRENTGTTDRLAMASVAKRSLIQGLQALCRGANLKLVAVTPRFYAIASAVQRLGASAEGCAQAVLFQGQRWIELTILLGQTVVQSRSIGIGTGLAGEVKRTLGLLSSQQDIYPQDLLVSSRDSLPADFQESVGLPLRNFDPFRPEDNTAGIADRGSFTSAVGLLQGWATKESFPVNFVAPKEPKVVKDTSMPVKIAMAATILVTVGALWFWSSMVLAGKTKELADTNKQLADVKVELTKMDQDRADIDKYKEWDKNSAHWLDDFYDLAQYFPWEHKGIAVKKISGSLTPAAKGTKDKSDKIAHLAMVGNIPDPNSNQILSKFYDTVNKDKHFRPIAPKSVGGTGEWSFTVEILKQEPKDYKTVLLVPQQKKAAPAVAEVVPPPTGAAPTAPTAKSPAGAGVTKKGPPQVVAEGETVAAPPDDVPPPPVTKKTGTTGTTKTKTKTAPAATTDGAPAAPTTPATTKKSGFGGTTKGKGGAGGFGGRGVTPVPDPTTEEQSAPPTAPMNSPMSLLRTPQQENLTPVRSVSMPAILQSDDEGDVQ